MIGELIALLLACILLYLFSWLVCVAMWRSRRIASEPRKEPLPPARRIMDDARSGFSGLKHRLPGRLVGSNLQSPV